MKILLLNGPNLNLLGKREADIYGSMTLDELNSKLIKIADENGCNLDALQSNAEHELINAIPVSYTHLTLPTIYSV